MNRIAVIDLGTNTFHLLITETDGSISPGDICKETIAVKLGQGGINQGFINPEAFERGINAIKKIHELIVFHQASKVKAVATAAIRSASNGNDFIAEIKRITGIDIEIIDGDKEAGLIYQGVRKATNMSEKPSLVMDIGGGSTEFIICNSSEVFWKKSYPIGAAKMMDLLHHSDPISNEDTEKITEHLDETLVELHAECQKYRPQTLIGSAGAFETFAELVKRRFNPEGHQEETFSTEIQLEHFHEIAFTLLQSTHKERAQMPGLIALRVDMIVVATIITQHALRLPDIKNLVLSNYSLKEGILFDLLS